MALFIRADIDMTNPLEGNPRVPVPPITSDTFSGPSGPLPAATNAALGGQSLPWIRSEAVALSGGRLVDAPGYAGGSWFAGVAVGFPDVLMEWTVSQFPAAVDGSLYFDIRRSAGGDAIRAVVTGTSIDLRKRVGGSTTTLAPAVPLTAGARIALEARGSRVVLRINGNQVAAAQVTDAGLLGGGNVGVAGSIATGWALDDFVVSPA